MVLTFKGHAHGLKNETHRALTSLRTAIELRPKNIMAWLLRGNCRFNDGDRQQAISDYLAAQRVATDEPGILMLRGEALLTAAIYSDYRTNIDSAMRRILALALEDLTQAIALGQTDMRFTVIDDDSPATIGRRPGNRTMRARGRAPHDLGHAASCSAIFCVTANQRAAARRPSSAG